MQAARVPDRSSMHAGRGRRRGPRRGAADAVNEEARRRRSAQAVFLDRDGTLIEEVGYLDRRARVELYPWTIDAIRALNRARFLVVLVTNQSGVARGFFSEANVEE